VDCSGFAGVLSYSHHNAEDGAEPGDDDTHMLVRAVAMLIAVLITLGLHMTGRRGRADA
jgi:hypothetical protein